MPPFFSLFLWIIAVVFGVAELLINENCREIDGNAKSDFYKLCLTEKYFILNDLGDNKSLNKKFVNKCRHQKKLLISSVLCEDSVG